MADYATLRESDPYRPGALTGGAEAKRITTLFNRTQIFFLLLMFLWHLFFWAMLLTWVEMWVTANSFAPLPLRDLTMIRVAFVCVITTGVTLYAVWRRMNFVSVAATVGSVAAFTILLFVDWYG